MNDEKKYDDEGYGNYLFKEYDKDNRPLCTACKDPVKVVYYNGVPKYAQHCRECYAELMWGKIPKPNRRRKSL